LFENLRYVVIDELHMYRGVFGSHLAKRAPAAERIADFYGQQPQFICSSATHSQPGRTGAAAAAGSRGRGRRGQRCPFGGKVLVFYNPPVVTGSWASAGVTSTNVAAGAGIRQTGLQTIVFANSRLHTEVLLTYLKQANPVPPGVPTRYGAIAADTCRCSVARSSGVAQRQIRAVVATNALELGIDVGSLDISVMAGYPGTIASTLQRAGARGPALRALVARAGGVFPPPRPVHRQEPRVFLRWHPGTRLHPADKPRDPVNHLKCAAFELPLQGTEKFGSADWKRSASV